ncbi:MAG: DUF87 domain-containing protein [Candidatus Gracilibacteria bacterium]|nr:DUF87 domain-containing protein [Candidatus Gracilibacteria bacterium]MDD3119850.1 DUF87 domain-containing protein [Candidatus Gracilibacteria bacterium]MDD4530039.1 DUF87 domain-containing protein [Candidatus Gracilibacteria bacterium]
MSSLRVLIPKKDSDLDEKKETVKDSKEQISLMEQLLSSLNSIYSKKLRQRFLGQDYISLEYVTDGKEILFYVMTPKKYRVLVEKQITAIYPDALVEETIEVNVFKNKKIVKAANIKLKKPYYYPIKTYQKLESDPMNNIVNSLSKLGEDESAVLQIILKPVEDSWRDKVSKIDERISKGFGAIPWNPLNWIMVIIETLFNDPNNKDKKPDEPKDENEEEGKGMIKEKGKKVGYDVKIRAVCAGQDETLVDNELKNIISSFSQYKSPGFNSFVKDFFSFESLVIRNYIFRYFQYTGIPFFPFKRKQILNTEEIASIFHFPSSKYNRTPEIKWQNFKLVKAPINLPEEGIILGHNYYRGVKKEVRIMNEDRFRHFYVIGQTGTGKSSIMQVMGRQDLISGNGLAVMDPHGDLVNDLLPFVPRDRADDIVYFNPGDITRPMGLNLLEADTDDDKPGVVQDALNIMIKLFGNEIFGPRIQDYFRNGCLALMDFPAGGALVDIIRIFTDNEFQKERVRHIKDPVVKSWWEVTYAKMGDREKAEIIPYFAAKFGGFITNTVMRNIIGQVKSSFNVNEIMQSQRIFLINLSKGILGDVNSNLLGLIVVSKIQMAAMARAKMEKEERKDFFLYIDEFQNYVTDSIESILSEARKYRLGLIVAHQYLAQLQKSDALTKSNLDLSKAIFGNVGSIMSYKIGPEDAEFMAKQFTPIFSEQDLINMDKFKGVMKLCIGGQASPAFSMIPTNPYLETGDKSLAKAYKELSRLKYGRDREFVEKEIIFRIGA